MKLEIQIIIKICYNESHEKELEVFCLNTGRYNMKNIKKLGALLCSACLVVSGTTIPTMADSMKVVTLGADLTDAQ